MLPHPLLHTPFGLQALLPLGALLKGSENYVQLGQTQWAGCKLNEWFCKFNSITKTIILLKKFIVLSKKYLVLMINFFIFPIATVYLLKGYDVATSKVCVH